VHAVLSSPLRRAQETAAPIAHRCGVPLETDADLDEVWLGPWIGKTWEELRDDPDIRSLSRDPLHVSAAFESATHIHERVVRLAERLRQSHADKTVVLISHGDPLRVLVSHYVAIPLAKYRSLAIGNGSISRLHLHDGGAQLLLLNWQPPTQA
jgi:probable phosphoglycerate mutase